MEQMPWIKPAVVDCKSFEIKVTTDKRQKKNPFVRFWKVTHYGLDAQGIRPVEHGSGFPNDEDKNQVNVYISIGPD